MSEEYTELGYHIEMPGIGNAYRIVVYVDGYEPAPAEVDARWSFDVKIIQWQTYCHELNDDIQHTMFDQWIQADSLPKALMKISKLIEKMS